MIRFTYKKFTATPAVKAFTHRHSIIPVTLLFAAVQGPELQSIPDWLELKNWRRLDAGDPNFDALSLLDARLIVGAIDGLAPGVYTREVVLRRTVRIGSIGYNTEVLFEAIPVELEVVDSPPFDVNPTVLVFQGIAGQASNQQSLLSIQGVQPWTLKTFDPWIDVSQKAGLGKKDLTVMVDTQGLDAGIHSSRIVVKSGPKTLTVKLEMLLLNNPDGSSGSQSIRVDPAALEFVEARGELPQKIQTLRVECSEAVTLSSAPWWIRLSEQALDAGIHEVKVRADGAGVQQIEGVFYGEIVLQSAQATLAVTVLLRVVDAVISAVSSGQFYYAQDRNRITLSSALDQAVACMDFRVKVKDQQSVYQKKVPFFRGLASSVIGLETQRLLGPEVVLQPLQTQYRQAYDPLLMDIAISEQQRFRSEQRELGSYSDLRFINGRSPRVSDRLCELPQLVHQPADAVLGLSFYAEKVINSVELFGAVQQEIPLQGKAIAGVFTALVNLEDYPLRSGDVLGIRAGAQQLQVVVRPDQAQHTLLCFENQWNMPEYYMLCGHLEIIREKGWRSALRQDQGQQHSQVIDQSERISYRLRSGWVYTQEQRDWLGTLFLARRWFLWIDGQQTQVVPTMSKLKVYTTRGHLVDYLLTFEKAKR